MYIYVYVYENMYMYIYIYICLNSGRAGRAGQGGGRAPATQPGRLDLPDPPEPPAGTSCIYLAIVNIPSVYCLGTFFWHIYDKFLYQIQFGIQLNLYWS